MHVLLQHLSVYQVLTTKLIDFLLTDEFVFVVDHFSVLLLQFFSDTVNIRHPFRTRTQLRDEIAAYLGVVQSG